LKFYVDIATATEELHKNFLDVKVEEAFDKEHQVYIERRRRLGQPSPGTYV